MLLDHLAPRPTSRLKPFLHSRPFASTSIQLSMTDTSSDSFKLIYHAGIPGRGEVCPSLFPSLCSQAPSLSLHFGRVLLSTPATTFPHFRTDLALSLRCVSLLNLSHAHAVPAPLPRGNGDALRGHGADRGARRCQALPRRIFRRIWCGAASSPFVLPTRLRRTGFCRLEPAAVRAAGAQARLGRHFADVQHPPVPRDARLVADRARRGGRGRRARQQEGQGVGAFGR